MDQRELEKVLSSARLSPLLPNGLNLELDISKSFLVRPHHQKGSGGAVLSPIEVELHRVAVKWCLALAALPAKSLPRGQRHMIKILQRLTPEPTGNQAVDQGRRLLLDNMIKTSLWSPMTSELSRLFGGSSQSPGV